MGLSNLPAPSEGVLCVILVNTALSISIVKGIVRSILHSIGIHLSSSSSSASLSPEPPSNPVEPNDETLMEFCISSPDGYIEEFRNRVPAARFDAVCCQEQEQNCSVCLTQFEPDSEINILCCGHVFHNVCLEKWLDYWNTTCPNCRSSIIPDKDPCCFW